MYIAEPHRLAAALAKTSGGTIDNTQARALIEQYAHAGHDSRTHRLVVVGGISYPVANAVADELASLRQRLGTLQSELRDRIRKENMGRNSHSLSSD